MTESKTYQIKNGAKAHFVNNVDYCVGTGRMGLALQKEYYEQLKLAQEHIGFKYIRGHGLFNEDMAIYQETTDRRTGTVYKEYNFTYLDLVMDSYLSLNIRPFLELGFMPKKMASGEQAIFYWRGNVTPPKDYNDWTNLVVATLKHLMERYGADEVVTWPIEVWNEPNLRGFWKDADMDEYFKLYRLTAIAIKELDVRFRVGGPAVCGVEDDLWIRSFLEFCKSTSSPLDFITRHYYTIKTPQMSGHYGYAQLVDDGDAFYSQLISTRNIIDSFVEYKDMQIHITEFNTSYSPITPLHDTNCNAAYLAYLLSKLGDQNESYSYWTFGDIFEENGVPFSQFHGGFGLVANGSIPKPTFWTFNFFKQLMGECVHRSDDSIIVKKEDGKYYGVAWNKSTQRTGKKLELSFELPAFDTGDFCVMKKIVDEEYCNPLKIWHDLGEPANPSKEQQKIIRDGAYPFIVSQREKINGETMKFNLDLSENAVIYFEVSKVNNISDRGFDYERVMSQT